MSDEGFRRALKKYLRQVSDRLMGVPEREAARQLMERRARAARMGRH